MANQFSLWWKWKLR